MQNGKDQKNKSKKVTKVLKVMKKVIMVKIKQMSYQFKR